jgi:GTP cyclohydrolase I
LNSAVQKRTVEHKLVVEFVRRREEDSGLEDVPERVRRRYRFVVAGLLQCPNTFTLSWANSIPSASGAPA